MRNTIIMVPGAVLPAELAYSALAAEFPDGDVVMSDLALYDEDDVPLDYSLGTEVAKLERLVAKRDPCHLVGYSAGGAMVVSFCARHPDMVASLALLEPAWLGNDGMSPRERQIRAEIDAALTLPPDQAMLEFVRLSLVPGATPPPAPTGDPPPWMRKRPAGLRALTAAFARHRLETSVLEGFAGPVLYVLGGKSNPAQYGEVAERAGRIFANFRLEVFPERHHFDPPHRAEPVRLAAILRDLWQAAESAA